MTTRPCTHCGLEVRGAAADQPEDEPVFCCAGCEAVYYTLKESGLDEFYDRRQSWSVDQPRPVDEEVLDAEDMSFFDNPTFLDDHASAHDDGTRSIELYLEGVHCGGCVWLVERMPRLVDGVVDARLQLTRGRLTLRWNPERIELSAIASWLSDFGFRARPLRTENIERRSTAGKKMLTRVGICWAVAANVMLLTIALYAGLDADSNAGLYSAVLWSTFGLSAISLVAGGSVFFRRAIASFRSGRLSMDVPISLGIAVGWGHSAWATISGSGEVWFDSIVVLIAALLTARYLQIRGNSLAADAAERLVSLLPRTARRFADPGGDEVEVVPADALQIGDRIRVLGGDVIPADGRVISGQGDVSRAVLTGESRPESIDTGDAVEAGTTNLSNPLVVDVTATGDDTRVGQLMEWVESSGTDRAPVVQLADRLSAVFIGVVLTAAAITAIAWSIIDPGRAVANVVALLVIACPCALGMATPLALTVGIGQAARRGIHVKRDATLEALAGVTDIVFDKTGTLTDGRPSVIEAFGDISAARRACAIEVQSNHPIADCLVDWARDTDELSLDDITVDAVDETPGAGIEGCVDGRTVKIGRLSWFDDVSRKQRAWAEHQAYSGHTPVAVGVDGDVIAIIAVGDELREGVVDIVDRIRRRGARVHLLSGDHPDVVAATGQQLGIDGQRVIGGASPERKLQYIESLRDRDDACIAMVGDGVNDAAALDAADIGIAVHGGTEASLVAADVFVVRDGVEPIAELLDGTDRVMNVVRRNLAGSGVYNLFGISLAALGFITPLAAAILMPLSSLGVVTSSLIQSSFSESPTESAPDFADVDDLATADATPATPAVQPRTSQTS